MTNYFKIWRKNFGLELASEMAYKTNFFIKMFSFIFMDMLGPLITFVIYTSTSGIPGWSLYEFLFFQGTLVLVMGLNHFAFIMIPHKVVDMVRKGNFDKVLVRPVNILGHLTASAPEFEGLAEVIVGIFLIVFSAVMLKIQISFSIFLFIYLILLALLFHYSLCILISALAFLVVKSYALFDLMFQLNDFARYPIDIYPSGVQFAVTFLLPLAVSSFYPSQAVLHGISFTTVALISLSVFSFFAVAILLWSWGIRKYKSAGG